MLPAASRAYALAAVLGLVVVLMVSGVVPDVEQHFEQAYRLLMNPASAMASTAPVNDQLGADT